jgi:hypothetical protein
MKKHASTDAPGLCMSSDVGEMRHWYAGEAEDQLRKERDERYGSYDKLIR